MESRSGSKRRYDEVEPRVQRRIVAEYRQGVRGYGYIATAKRLQLPVSTVRGVIARAERAGGDPVAPRGHKKRKLDSGEEVKLCRALEQNSTATNSTVERCRARQSCSSHGERLLSSRGSALHNEGYPRSRTRRIE